VITFVVSGSKTNMPRSKFPVTVMSVKHMMSVFPLVDANKNAKTWKETVGKVALVEMNGRPPLEGPLRVTLTFLIERPKTHLLSDGVSLSAEGLRRPNHCQKPDVLKLARAVEDGMTGVVYVDDSQIIEEILQKRWAQAGELPGAYVSVEVLS
jgi:Holliday junction resolvase RusA-like endonuclease